MAQKQASDEYSRYIDNLIDSVAQKVFNLDVDVIRAMSPSHLRKLYEKRTAGKSEDEKRAVSNVLELVSVTKDSPQYEHTIGKLTTYTGAYVPLKKLVQNGAITKEQSTNVMIKLLEGGFPAIRADPQDAEIVNEMFSAIKFAHGLLREARQTRSEKATTDLISFLGIRYGDEDLAYSVKYVKENGYGRQWDNCYAEAKALVSRINEQFVLTSTIQLAQNEAVNLQTGRQYSETADRARQDGEKATDDYLDKVEGSKPKPKKNRDS